MDVSKMERYSSPIHQSNFPHFTVSLCGLGLLFMAYFLVYEVTESKQTRSLFKELSIALIAAVFLGFGSLFLLLWVGIYV
ncbi:hypothetical protein WR25_05349 [Diploscapter pachys]|uniref:Dolichyl-diphosphooligosaccharide-protein glycosyltransferase subunit TMEM258 n=1 Tax=Diploscapter pachys TaxID=2018661 RepID=A0A2A2K9X4_9BILA|nr:hypothetical protein WR25_08836 [Diploscapter pachys]PAV70712.1 hypothetical protein WR25_05349 [Diploscapter pachys]